MEQPPPSGSGTGPTTSFVYDTITKLLTEDTDAAGNVTGYQYNEALRLKRIVNPDGSHVVLDAADTHYMVANFPGLGGNVTHAFPLADARVPVAGPNGSSLGAPGSWTDEAGRISQYTVDRFGNLTSWTDPLGSTTMWLRDDLGLVTQIISPGANDSTTPLSTDFYYVGTGPHATDLASVVYPDGTSEIWTYDSASNRVTSHTDQAGRVTTYEIDSTTHLVNSMTQGGDPAAGSDDVAALLATTTYTYTTADDGVPAGLVETVTDPLGRITHFEYYDNSVQSGHVAGLLKTITYAVGTPDEAARQFAYNDAREIISSTDELGRETDFQRDDLGRVTATTLDAVHAGPTTTYQYTALNDVLAVTDALGRTTAYRYDSRNNVERAIMPAPGEGQGLVAPEIVYGYNADRSKATVIDVLGHVTRTDYDGDGRVATVTAPDPDGPGTDHPLTSPVTHYLYYADSRLKSVEDANGNFVTYAYDTSGFGRVTTISAPDPTGATTYTVTHIGYNAVGQTTSVIDALGRETDSQFDTRGQLRKKTLPAPDSADPTERPAIGYEYDLAGELRRVVQPNKDLEGTQPGGPVTEYVYDFRGRVKAQIGADPDGTDPLASPITNFVYDAAGELTQSVDALSRVTTYVYDNLGERVSMSAPAPDGRTPSESPQWTYVYDTVGQMLATTDKLGNTSRAVYDDLGRTVEQVDANFALTASTFDLAGTTTSLTDSVGNKTTFVHDALGRLTIETNQLDASRTFQYDSVGNLTEETDRNGKARTWTYDHLYHLKSEKWFADQSNALSGTNIQRTISYSVDVGGQLLSASDPDSAYSFQYTKLGQLKSVDNLGTLDTGATGAHTIGVPDVVLTSIYDGLGARTNLNASIASTADFQNVYAHDDLLRTTQITQTGADGGNGVATKQINFVYDVASQLQSLTRFAGTGLETLVATSTYGHDLDGRLTSLVHVAGSGQSATTIAGYGWAYDPANRVTAFTNSVAAYAGENVTYNYDARSQLVGADRSGTTNDESFVYDANGNRTQTTIGGTTHTYTTYADNRLHYDGKYTYYYDAEGNMTSRVRDGSAAADDHTLVFDWDNRDRLVKITFKDQNGNITKVVEQIYDMFNRWIARKVTTYNANGTVAGTTIDRFAYDGQNIALEFDSSGNLTHRYLHGPAVDQILADEVLDPAHPENPGQINWQMTDNQTSVRDIISTDGTLLDHIEYTSFGAVKSETHPAAVDRLFGLTNSLALIRPLRGIPFRPLRAPGSVPAIARKVRRR